MELDGYIRGNPPTVGGRTVWSVDQDDDLVSGFKYDIRANHQEAFRANAALSNQRGAASQQRRAGAAGSGSNNASNKPRNLCYAYNGWNTTTNKKNYEIFEGHSTLQITARWRSTGAVEWIL